ncbi:MAG: helix-turn-helix domain-containing protein [Candidatus Hodarchaeales archaeon]
MLEINTELIKELEAFGLSNEEARIVSLLLKSTKTLTGIEISEEIGLPKHQLYSSLSKLEKQKLIKQVSFKPKKYFSDQITLNESLSLYEQQIENEINTFKSTSNSNEELCYQLLGFDQDQKQIHKFLLERPSTRNDLIRRINTLSYEKVRNITDFLISKNFGRKISSKGKSILYIGISLKEILENKIDSSNSDLNEKKGRIENIINLVEYKRSENKSPASTETLVLHSYDDILKKISQTLIGTKVVKSSLFLQSDENYSHWIKIIKTELNKALELIESGKKVLWLVNRVFVRIFADFENELIEQVLKSKPDFQLRVTKKLFNPMLIFDDDEVLELSSASNYLEKAITISDIEYTSLKSDEFSQTWDDGIEFRQVLGEMLDEKKLIYFISKDIKFKEMPVLSVALLGDKAVGKTSLVKRFLTEKFDPNLNYTLGILIDDAIIKLPKRSFSDIEQMKLMIFDFGGQPLFRQAYANLLEDKEGFALVFSLNEPESLNNLESWIELLGKEKLKNKFLLLIGTKADLDIKVNQDQIWDFRKAYRIENYYETSSVSGKNVRRVFEEVAENLSYKIQKNS